MKIVGLIETMIDWEGKSSYEIFLQGCNFRCPFCHNPELVEGSEDGDVIAEDAFLSYIKSDKKNRLHKKGIIISGGEPTINQGLSDFVRKIKDIGYLVKLDTNGTNPASLGYLIDEKLVDAVAMDVKTSLENYERATKSNVNSSDIKESIRKILSSSIDYEFRTTCVPELVNRHDVDELCKMISSCNDDVNKDEKPKRFVVQQFNPENCLDLGFRKKQPYSRDRLDHYAEIAKPYFQEVKIRNA